MKRLASCYAFGRGSDRACACFIGFSGRGALDHSLAAVPQLG